MTTAAVGTQIRGILADVARVPVDNIDTALSAVDHGVDSIALLGFRERIEQALSIVIPDNAWVALHSIDDIIRYAEDAFRSARKLSVESSSPQSSRDDRFWRRESRLISPGMLYDDIEVGMPLTGRINLAECPLLKYLGDLRWQHLSRSCGVPTRHFVDEEGDRLYPTFVYIEVAFPSQTPMAAFGENHRFRVASTIRRYGRSMLDGEAYLLPAEHAEASTPPFNDIEEAVAAGIPAVRLSNVFVKQFAGAEWLRKSRPKQHEFELIPEVTVCPDTYAAVKEAEKVGRFGLPSDDYVRMTDESSTLEYSLIPDRDLNGAGLVYFANYPVFLDICEREMLAHAKFPLTHELLDRRTVVRRRSAYLNNASSRDTLEVQIDAWVQNPLLVANPAPESAPVRLFLNYRMLRKSDRRVIMISTAEKIIYERTMSDTPFFSQLAQNERVLEKR